MVPASKRNNFKFIVGKVRVSVSMGRSRKMELAISVGLEAQASVRQKLFHRMHPEESAFNTKPFFGWQAHDKHSWTVSSDVHLGVAMTCLVSERRADHNSSFRVMPHRQQIKH